MKLIEFNKYLSIIEFELNDCHLTTFHRKQLKTLEQCSNMSNGNYHSLFNLKLNYLYANIPFNRIVLTTELHIIELYENRKMHLIIKEIGTMKINYVSSAVESFGNYQDFTANKRYKFFLNIANFNSTILNQQA